MLLRVYIHTGQAYFPPLPGIFRQACPLWIYIYTQSNITQAPYSPEFLYLKARVLNNFTIRERFRNFSINPGHASSIFNIKPASFNTQCFKQPISNAGCSVKQRSCMFSSSTFSLQG